MCVVIVGINTLKRIYSGGLYKFCAKNAVLHNLQLLLRRGKGTAPLLLVLRDYNEVRSQQNQNSSTAHYCYSCKVYAYIYVVQSSLYFVLCTCTLRGSIGESLTDRLILVNFQRKKKSTRAEAK